MWKDILAFVDGSEDGLARLKMALEFSRRCDAHLEAQVMAVMPQRPVGPSTAALEDVYREIAGAAQKRGDDALAAIRELAPSGEAFSAYRTDAFPDDLRETAAVLARPHDLVVLGLPQTQAGVSHDSDILTGALFSGGPPCLLLPRWIAPHAWGRRLLIAWKGAPQAARAVQAALPLLKNGDAVRILVVDPREDKGEDEQALARLAVFLTRHGARIEAPVTMRSEYDDRVGQAILDEAQAFGADLLVMGAYGHTRLAEFVFGGVTRHILRNAPIATLMAH